MRKPIFPIPFEVMRKYKYLCFILTDIFMGVGTWLLKGLLFNPKPLLTTSGFLDLFVSLWFFYLFSFYMYEYAKRKNKKQMSHK
jgi:hypothetical protein